MHSLCAAWKKRATDRWCGVLVRPISGDAARSVHPDHPQPDRASRTHETIVWARSQISGISREDKALAALDTIVLTLPPDDDGKAAGSVRGLDPASVVRTVKGGPRKLLLGPGTLFRVSVRRARCWCR